MLILGGGVAGLAASLASGAPVYEASDSIGGMARSRQVDGFTFDYGIHVLQTQHPTINELFRSLGVGLCTRRRRAMIYSHRVYTAYPFQVNTAGLPFGLRAHCLWQYLWRKQNGDPENYQEWIYRNLGRGFGDTFLIPYSEKFWTVHPREMTHEWTASRIPPTSLWQIVRGAILNRQTKVGTNATFRYPEHGTGFGAIPARMGKDLPQVHLKHRATCIDITRRRVEFNVGTIQVPYDQMVSTIPLPALIPLIPDAPPEVREAARRLRWNSILVVNLGIANARLSDCHWVHFPEKDVSFFRISYPHNLGPGMVPEGMSSVAAEVAYSEYQPVDKSTIIDRVIADLIRVGAIGAHDRIVVKDLMDIPYGYVVYDRNRKVAVRTIRRWLESVGIYPTGRYGLWAYLWSHQAILAGRQAGLQMAARHSGLSLGRPVEHLDPVSSSPFWKIHRNTPEFQSESLER
jgi:protoporphyrinogen oxidase